MEGAGEEGERGEVWEQLTTTQLDLLHARFLAGEASRELGPPDGSSSGLSRGSSAGSGPGAGRGGQGGLAGDSGPARLKRSEFQQAVCGLVGGEGHWRNSADTMFTRASRYCRLCFISIDCSGFNC